MLPIELAKSKVEAVIKRMSEAGAAADTIPDAVLTIGATMDADVFELRPPLSSSCARVSPRDVGPDEPASQSDGRSAGI